LSQSRNFIYDVVNGKNDSGKAKTYKLAHVAEKIRAIILVKKKNVF